MLVKYIALAPLNIFGTFFSIAKTLRLSTDDVWCDMLKTERLVRDHGGTFVAPDWTILRHSRKKLAGTPGWPISTLASYDLRRKYLNHLKLFSPRPRAHIPPLSLPLSYSLSQMSQATVVGPLLFNTVVMAAIALGDRPKLPPPRKISKYEEHVETKRHLAKRNKMGSLKTKGRRLGQGGNRIQQPKQRK